MDVQGWYQSDPPAERVRVRVAIDGDSLVLSRLSDQPAVQPIARWSLGHLKNRSIPIYDRLWVIGDRRMRDPTLTLENDEHYREIQRRASGLVAPGRRTWHQFLSAAGNPSGLLALIVLVVLALVMGLWKSL